MIYLNRFLRVFVSVSNRFSISVFCLIVGTLFLVSCSDRANIDIEQNDLFDLLADPEGIEEYLYDLAETDSAVSYERLGQSEDGNWPISKIIITSPDGPAVRKPAVLIVSALHGNETTSLYIVLRLIEYLCEMRETSPRILQLLETRELHFIPTANPWGIANAFRYNDNNVDLNRNFGFAWEYSASHGAAPFDQAETNFIRDDALLNNYYMNISFHSGEACISTVWDYIGTTESSGTPSLYSYEQFTTEYLPNAESVFMYAEWYSSLVNDSGDESFYDIEGYDWYRCYGTMGDWFFAERGSLPFTIEVSRTKSSDDPDYLNDLWNYQKEALLDLLENNTNLLTGYVYDSDDGTPLEAHISLIRKARSNRDPQPYTLFTYSDNESGAFAIIADPGSYDVKVTSDGYQTADTQVVLTAENEEFAISLNRMR
ncbi:MAG: DUF2817 domain-containing protein [Spirochaetes bacterium]|jgi:hypothetical protein|nr:DUF2817 domain-containing protein [Spirochaetota bacterium]